MGRDWIALFKVLLFFLVGRIECRSEVRLKWNACKAPFKLPEGFTVECARTSHPLYYDDRRSLHLGRPIELMTRRYKSPFDVEMLAKAESQRPVYWLISGGPGSEAEDIERRFGAGYLENFASSNAIVYFLNHRGTHQASPLPTLTRLLQTVNNAENLLKQAKSWMKLDAMLPTEAAHDFASIIEAVMLEDMDCEHYLHGFSYGGYLALEVASILARPDHIDGYFGSRLKGLVIDSGLPIDFVMNGDLREDSELLEELMKNCQKDFYCRRFTSPEIVREGFQAFLEGSNDCALATHRILSNKKNEQDNSMGDALCQLVSNLLSIESQEIEILSSDANGNPSPSYDNIQARADGRIMAVQFLTHLSACNDRERFAELFLVIGGVLELKGVSDVLREMGLLEEGKKARFRFRETLRRRDAPLLEGGGEDDGVKYLKFNHLLYANIIFTRFWDYDKGTGLDSSPSEQLASSFLPSMQRAAQEYCSARPALQSPPLIRFAPNTALRVLMMSGGLDSRLSLKVMQRLYDSIPIARKSMVIFQNRSHTVIDRLLSGRDDCPIRVLRSFFSLPEGDEMEIEDGCVGRENDEALDWRQEDLKISGLHYWEMSHSNWLIQLCFAISKLYWAHPIWTMILAGATLLLVCLMVILVAGILRLRTRRRLSRIL